MSAENPSNRPGLDRAADSEDAGAAMRHALDGLYADHLMARNDPGAMLTRKMESVGSLALPGIGQIDEMVGLDRVDVGASNAEVESLLSLDKFSDLVVEGIRLQDLLDGGGPESEKKMVKRGLTFLKKRLYAEAAEWWLLNRATLEPGQHRLKTVLSLLLALTYRLNENEAAAHEILQEMPKGISGGP